MVSLTSMITLITTLITQLITHSPRRQSSEYRDIHWTAFSDYTGPDLLCSTVFHF